MQGLNYGPAIQSVYYGQVLTTFGDQRSNITLGYTFRLDNDRLYQQEEGWLTIGAMQPLSPSLTFITDNSIRVRASFFNGTLARMGAALRINRRFHAFDLGLLSSVGQVAFYGGGYSYNYTRFKVYPYLGYNVRFGRR